MGTTKGKKLFAGKYQLLGRIGEGGMCEVFRAQQIHLQRDVALKVLRRELAEEADERERFLREARTCAKLEHANIVQIFEVGEAGNRPYIAMEYVDGNSLKDLNDEGITLERSLTVAREVALALASAHGTGVLHRDLKPENILIAKDGTVKVADWGLAKGLEDKEGLTRAGMVLGTPQYISPDQIRQKGVTPSADLYSLGVIIFESVSSQLPFHCSSVFEYLQAHLRREPPKLKSVLPIVPAKLDKLVNSLLDKEPAGRPATAFKVAQELHFILAQLEGKQLHDLASPLELSVAEGPIFGSTEQEPTKLKVQEKKGPANKLFIFVLLALLCCSLTLVLDKLGVGQTLMGGRQKRALEVHNLHMVAFDEIALQYSGGQAKDVVLVKIANEKEPISLPLSRGRQVSKELFELRCQLLAPLLEPVEVTVDERRFLLSPQPLVDKILEPVDELKGKKLVRLLSELTRLRDHFERLRRTSALSRLQVERAYNDVLEGYGLNKKAMRGLSWLPKFIKKEHLPGSPFARRLLPLRRVNLVLADVGEVEPPWGHIDELLGIKLSLNKDQPHFKLPWRTLCYVDFGKIVKVTHGGRARAKKLNLWMSYPEHFQKLKGSAKWTTFSTLIYENTLVTPTEVAPRRASDIVTEKSIDFEVKPSNRLVWPPKEASLDFSLKAFGRQLSLGVRLNDGPLSIIMNGKPLGERSRQQAFFAKQWVTLPIDPRQLRRGKNTIHLSVERIRPLKWTLDKMAIDGVAVTVNTEKKSKS